MSPGEWTGILVGVGTVLVGVATVLHAEFQRRRQGAEQRTERAIQLHEFHYSEDFFSRVALPVFSIARRWDLLPPADRDEYRAAILLGWVDYNSAASLAAMTVGQAADDPAATHFRPQFAGEALSEHEALAICLHFWTRLSLLARMEVLNREVARQLLAWTYSYVSPFFGQLAETIVEELGAGEIPPQWIDAIPHLDAWLLPPPTAITRRRDATTVPPSRRRRSRPRR